MKQETDAINKETRLHIIDLLRTAACLMIFFYHCNTILPGSFKWLTFFGEDMGNELFFLISGFALQPSIEKTEMRDLPGWYLKRLRKILPMLVIFYGLSYLTGFYALNDPAQIFAVFIYPTLYWFVTAILVFYLLLFLFLKAGKGPLKWIVPIVILAAYLFRSDTMEGYYLIGAFSMMTGALLRERLEIKGAVRNGISSSGAVVFFIAYMITKYLKFSGKTMAAGPINLAFVFPGITACIVGCFLLALGFGARDDIGRFFNGKDKAYGIIRYIGTLALPVYMVQCFNAGIIGYTIGLKINFPLSFIVNMIVIWGLAMIADRLLK